MLLLSVFKTWLYADVKNAMPYRYSYNSSIELTRIPDPRVPSNPVEKAPKLGKYGAFLRGLLRTYRSSELFLPVCHTTNMNCVGSRNSEANLTGMGKMFDPTRNPRDQWDCECCQKASVFLVGSVLYTA